MENFGNFERPFNESEKEIVRKNFISKIFIFSFALFFLKITKFLKYDKHVPLRIAEMVYSAEV